MNNFTKGLFTTISALVLGFTASAQQRQVDLEANITTPASNSTFNYNDQISLTIEITNNGPDAMVVGDSIFYMVNLSQDVQMGTLTQAIPAGDKFSIPLTFTNVNVTGTDQTTDVCVLVFEPNTQVTQNNNPISVSYLDTDTSNNTFCITNITLKSGSVSVDKIEVAATSLNIYPNPATDKVGFRYTAQAQEDVVVTVTDILGREVIRKNFGSATIGNEATYELDITNLKTGNYFLSVYNGALQTNGRIVVK